MTKVHKGDDITRQVDEGACESDRAFFRAHPQRRFRLRPAWTAEIEDFARHGAIYRELPDGLMWWVTVHQLTPGARVRFPLPAPHHFPTEVSEAGRATFGTSAARMSGKPNSDSSVPNCGK